VGDSITYGALIQRRSRHSHPAQLQRLPGRHYAVRNFGSGGCTLEREADQPHWDDKNFTLSSEFEPDIVLIMLGTNDTKAHNRQGMLRFIIDIRAATAAHAECFAFDGVHPDAAGARVIAEAACKAGTLPG
jgi:lysophospholipase L1-like esterase